MKKVFGALCTWLVSKLRAQKGEGNLIEKGTEREREGARGQALDVSQFLPKTSVHFSFFSFNFSIH